MKTGWSTCIIFTNAFIKTPWKLNDQLASSSLSLLSRHYENWMINLQHLHCHFYQDTMKTERSTCIIFAITYIKTLWKPKDQLASSSLSLLSRHNENWMINLHYFHYHFYQDTKKTEWSTCVIFTVTFVLFGWIFSQEKLQCSNKDLQQKKRQKRKKWRKEYENHHLQHRL